MHTTNAATMAAKQQQNGLVSKKYPGRVHCKWLEGISSQHNNQRIYSSHFIHLIKYVQQKDNLHGSMGNKEGTKMQNMCFCCCLFKVLFEVVEEGCNATNQKCTCTMCTQKCTHLCTKCTMLSCAQVYKKYTRNQ